MPEDYIVWHHLAPWTPDAPDFLIRTPEGAAVVLKVSAASAQEVHPAAQMLLLGRDEPELGIAEESVVKDFLSGLEQTLGDADPPPIQAILIFPNIEQKKLRAARPASSRSSIQWLGKDSSITFSSGIPLSEAQWEHLRRAFTPEVIVPAALTVRKAPGRHIDAKLTGFLLDYDQEAAIKTDLALNESGEPLAGNFRLNLVNGVTGSGKSLILLYRLRLLYELYPGKNFLVLTHNRALIRDLEARFYRLTRREPENIRWFTFIRWCRVHWPDDEPWHIPVGVEKQDALLRRVKTKTRLTTGMLRSEVAWVKDNAITNRESYLEADRRRRGFGLTREQRNRVFAAIREYQAQLHPRGDWYDVPLKMWQFIEQGRVTPQTYDVVLVDEAQFFAPVWFKIVQRLVKPQSGHLFLAADPTQGFLRQGISWKSLGLEVRGRSYRLKHSYRTTRRILSFAARFYQMRVPNDAESTDILTPDLRTMPAGTTPVIIPLTSPQDEIIRIANEVAALVKQGMRREDILVLHTDAIGVKQLITAIDRQLGRGAALDPKDSYPGNYVRVTTVNAGTGLESPIVFLVGVNRIFEGEGSLRLSEADRAELVLNNTRKIYMAATRAGQKLTISIVGEIPEILRQMSAEGICEIMG